MQERTCRVIVLMGQIASVTNELSARGRPPRGVLSRALVKTRNRIER